MLPRSCNKPLQALAMREAGLPLEGELLALACASHSGEPFHIEAVRRILASAGVSEDELQTPADYPLDDEAREQLCFQGQSGLAHGQRLLRLVARARMYRVLHVTSRGAH